MTQEMACYSSHQQIDRSGQHEKPSSEKVQTPTPAVLIEYVVGSACAYRRTRILGKKHALFPTAMPVVSTNGQFNQCRCQIVSHLAPVEPGVGHKYHNASESQRHEAYGHDPVR